MKDNLLFDFNVDKTTNTIFVDREFAAGQSQVWDAFTKEDILDQWWGPQPWASRTKVMEFKEGGRRLYAMVGPEGQEHWSLQEFTSIKPISHFRMFCSFTDKDENINTDFPKSDWDLNFTEENGTTKVSIVIHYQNAEIMQKMIDMGFKGGFTICLNQLNEMLGK